MILHPYEPVQVDHCPRCLDGLPLIVELPMQKRANKRWAIRCRKCQYTTSAKSAAAAWTKWHERQGAFA